MNSIYVHIAIMVVLLVIVFLVGRHLMNEADRVHHQLRQFRSQAEIYTTREDLVQLKASLKVYAAKECWHRHYTSHAQNVLDFINGRLQSIPHEQNR